jgi:uncharacterized protein YjbI with pentapeptide repeats
MITLIKNIHGDIIHKYYGDLIGAMLIYLDLKQADLKDLILEGAHFNDSDLTGADLSNADIYWGMFIGTNLTDAKLIGTDLRGADLTDAIMIRSDLSNANLGIDNVGGSTTLEGANLSDAILDKTNLKGAKYNTHTQFPAGFSPLSAGMILEEAKVPKKGGTKERKGDTD